MILMTTFATGDAMVLRKDLLEKTSDLIRLVAKVTGLDVELVHQGLIKDLQSSLAPASVPTPTVESTDECLDVIEVNGTQLKLVECGPDNARVYRVYKYTFDHGVAILKDLVEGSYEQMMDKFNDWKGAL